MGTSQTGKYLAPGHNEQISQREVTICHDLEADFFLSSPSTQSRKKISIFLFRAYLSFDPVK